jgi:hypothetical protein
MNDPAIPHDTSADAHAVQRDIYRRLNGRERLDIMFRLNESVRRLTMAGIRARHPHYTEDEIRRAYAHLILGEAVIRTIWPRNEPVDP